MTYNKERFLIAGNRLPARGCLAGVQADQEYLKKIFHLNRFLVFNFSVVLMLCVYLCVRVGLIVFYHTQAPTCTMNAATIAWQ